MTTTSGERSWFGNWTPHGRRASEHQIDAFVATRGDQDGSNTDFFHSTFESNANDVGSPPPYQPRSRPREKSTVRPTTAPPTTASPPPRVELDFRSANVSTSQDEQFHSPEPISLASASASINMAASVNTSHHTLPAAESSTARINQQPTASRRMEIASGGHKNARGVPCGADGDRDWSYGLYDCQNDIGTCCLACFCPCMIYSQNKRRLEHLVRHGTPEPGRNIGACSSDCCIHAFLVTALYGWAMQMGTRASIRMRYHIRGGGCADCSAPFFCTPCQLTQESREIELEEHSLWGWARPSRPSGLESRTWREPVLE